MYAETILAVTPAQRVQATRDRTLQHVRADRMLALAVTAIALVAAMLLAMVPGFAGVRIEGLAVPAPTPAPAPIVLESAR